MNKLAMRTILGALAIFSAGCYHHSFTVGAGGDTSADAQYSKWHSHWFNGWFGEENVDVKKVCPSGNATIKDYHSFLNSLVGAFIGIIWYPTTVEIFCDGGKKATITVSPHAMRAIARRADVMAMVREISADKACELSEAIDAYDREAAKTTASEPSANTF